MTLQPVHEILSLLRECRAVLLDHAEGLVYVFLDVRVWIVRGDDTLRSGHQRIRPLSEPHRQCLPYLGHAQHLDEQTPIGNDYRSCPVVQPVKWRLPREIDETNYRLSELQDYYEQLPHLIE